MRLAMVVLGACSLILTSVVPAEARRVATRVVQQGEAITAGPDRVASISGFLLSKRRCLKNRTITITDQNAAVFGTAKSDSNGNWIVNGDGPWGTYAIAVKKKRISRTVTCKSAFIFDVVP